MANDNKSREWLYKTLNKEGYNVGKDYAEFDSLMSNNADSRKWVFDTMSGLGYNVGKDYAEFEGLVNPLNSEPTDVITSSPSSQLPQAAQPNHDAKKSVNAAQGLSNMGFSWGQESEKPAAWDRRAEKPADVPTEKPVEKTETDAGAADNPFKFRLFDRRSLADRTFDRMNNRYEAEQAYQQALDDMNPLRGKSPYKKEEAKPMPKDELVQRIDKGGAKPFFDVPTNKMEAEAIKTDLAANRQLREHADYMNRKAYEEGYRENRKTILDYASKIDEQFKESYDKDRMENASSFYGVQSAARGEVGSRLLSPATRDLAAAKAQMDSAKKIIENATRNKSDRNGFLGFFEDSSINFWDAITDFDSWDFGMKSMEESQRVRDVLDKFDKGAQLSKSEQSLLDAVAMNTAANLYYSQDQGMGATVGETTGHMIPFMLQIAVSPTTGLGKMASSNVFKSLARWAAKSAAKKMAAQGAKYGTRLLTDLGSGYLMAGSVGLGHTLADAERRMTGTPVLMQTEGIHYGGREKGDDALSAYGKAFTSSAIEYQSEMVGEYFKPLQEMAGRFIVRGAANSNLGMLSDILRRGVRTYQRYGATPVAKFFDAVNNYTRYDGAVAEYVEEIVGNVENAAIVGDMEFNAGEQGIFNPEHNLETFLSVAVPGFVQSAFKTGAYYGMKGAKVLADKKASSLFGEDIWSSIKEEMDAFTLDMTAEEMNAALNGIAKRHDIRTADELKAMMRYNYFNLSEKALDMGVTLREEDKAAEMEDVVEGSKDAGSEMKTPEEVHAAFVDESSAAASLMSTERGASLKGRIDEMLSLNASAGELSRLVNDADVSLQDAANAYIRERAKNIGIEERAADEVRDAVENERTRMMPFVADAETGQMNPVIYQGSRGYIVGAEGEALSVLFDGSEEPVTILATDAEVQIERPVFLGDYLASYEQAISERKRAELEQSRVNHPNTKVTPVIGEVIQTPLGNRRVAFVNGEGNVFLEEDIMELNEETGQLEPKHQKEFRGEDAVSMSDYIQMQNDYWNGIDAEQKSADEAKALADEVQEEEEIQSPSSALERIEKDANGEPLYTRSDSQTAWDAIVEESDGDVEMAKRIANRQVAQAEARLKEIEESPLQEGTTVAEMVAAEKERKAAIAAAQAELDKWKDIAGKSVGQAIDNLSPVETEGGREDSLIPEDKRVVLNSSEISELIDALEDTAVPKPNVKYTKEEWDKRFKNPIMTPAGLVKMGEHQFGKLHPNGNEQHQDRREWIGLIYETLVNPTIIVEQYAPEEGAERDYKYVFVKSFISSNGESITYFASVSVKKNGMEAVITNHFKKYKEVKNLLNKGKLCFSSISPSGMQTEPTQPSASATTPLTNAGVSADKGTKNSETSKEKAEKKLSKSEFLSSLGEVVSMRDWLMRKLYGGGVKLIWKDSETSNTRGLGAHLGLLGSERERRKRIWALGNKDKGGLYPEEAAERLFSDYMSEMGYEGLDGDFSVTSQDMFNELIDVLLSNDTPSRLAESLAELHNTPIEESEEEAAMKDAWARDMGFTSYEEYEAYETYREYSTPSFTEEEYEKIHVENAEGQEYFLSLQQKEQSNTAENGQGTIRETDGGIQGSSSVLHSQRESEDRGTSGSNQAEGQREDSEVHDEGTGDLRQGDGDSVNSIEEGRENAVPSDQEQVDGKENVGKKTRSLPLSEGEYADMRQAEILRDNPDMDEVDAYNMAIDEFPSYIKEKVDSGELAELFGKLSIGEQIELVKIIEPAGYSRADISTKQSKQQENKTSRVGEEVHIRNYDGTIAFGKIISHENGEIIVQSSKTGIKYNVTEDRILKDVGSDEVVFRQGKRSSFTRAVENRAEQWRKSGIKVNIIRNFDDVENADARAAIEAGETVAGWYDVKTGEAYIYLPHNADSRDVDETIIHEVLSHKGLRGLLGEEGYNALCDKVWDVMHPADRIKFLSYPGVKGDKRAAADEFIAHLAEQERLKPEQQTVWNKIVDFFLNLFNSGSYTNEAKGILSKSSLTRDDISRLIRLSYAEMKRDGNADVKGNEGRRFRISDNAETAVLNSKQKKDGADLIGDDVRFKISKNNKTTISGWLNKRSDLTDAERESFMGYIDEFDASKQLATAKWFANGAIRVPEDMPKVDQAMQVAKKAKVDALQYKSPMDLIDAHADIKVKEKPINPDDVPTLSDRREIGNGIVTYLVEESDESRENMRRIINTHFGKDSSPWCLLQGDEDGELTSDSEYYWGNYSAYPKRVAFKDGKLTAFSANDVEDVVWWDRMDRSHAGIPVIGKIPNDEQGRSATIIYDNDGNVVGMTDIHKGNRNNGLYERWHDDGKLRERANYKDGQRDGLVEEWNQNGQLWVRVNFKDGEYDGVKEEYYYNDSQLFESANYKDGKLDGLTERYFHNGSLKERLNFKNDKLDGLYEYWHDNGNLRERSFFKNGKRDGLAKSYYSNGQLWERSNFKDGMLNGLHEEWNEDGQLTKLTFYKDGEPIPLDVNSGEVTRFSIKGKTLEEVNRKFNEELDDYITNGVKANNLFHIGMPHGVMRMFLPMKPIVMRPRIINKASKTKHNVDAVALYNLPIHISEPIFVFKREDNALGVLTEIKDRDGKNVCVAIELNKSIQDGGTLLEINDIRSIHGRDAKNLILPIIHNDTLKYVDKRKGLEWLSSASSNYQQEIVSQDLDSAAKVIEDFENPKLSDVKNVKTRFSIKGRNAEEQRIIDEAKKNGTWMKAPNGNPTHLTERQWVQVRTKAFKDWFGDWEKVLRIAKLRKAKDAVITGSEISEGEITKKEALEYGKTLQGEYTNADTGSKIYLQRGRKNGGVNEVLQHNYKDQEHLKSIAAIPQIIEKSIYIGSEANMDKVKNPNVSEFQHYVCGLKLGGVDYTVHSLIAVDVNGDRYYDHNLTQIEKTKLLDLVSQAVMGEDFGTTPDTKSTILSGYKGKRLISILQTNASKIVDENGEPMVVYHDTNSRIFINRETGENWDDLDWRARAEWEGRSDWDEYWEEQDFYTFDNKNHGRRSIEMPAFFFTPNYDEYHEYGDRTIAAFLNIRNPKFDPRIKDGGVSNTAGEDAMNALIEEGYDGFIRTEDGVWYETNAFHPNQIKSATENNGDFSKEENDIRFRTSNQNQLGFVSNAMKAVEDIKQDKATPEQWLKMIEKNGGLKAGEDKWLGLSDWLKSSDKKTLTKEDLLEFIGENMIQIEEVEYGGNAEYEEKLSVLNDEFVELIDEGEDATGSMYTSDWVDYAWDAMADRYGDDFRNAFTTEGRGTASRLVPEVDYDGNLTGESKHYLGIEHNPINSTRMEYTTEGLENKREIALTVPTIEPWNESDEIHFGDAGEGRAVAWVRFGESTDADGNRVLVIDEIQSKRHQEGREKGYRHHGGRYYMETEHSLHEFRILMREKYGRILNYNELYERLTPEEGERMEYLIQERNKAAEDEEKIPDAPFDKNWHELAMKRMLRLAAEESFDKVAWTTGSQQAERYNIGGTVEDIQSYDVKDGGQHIMIHLTDGNAVVFRVDDKGIVTRSDSYGYVKEGQPLSDIVGKELSNKIINKEGIEVHPDWNEGSDIKVREVSGEDLRIGGEGMRGFYDQILPRFMNKYGKKWGVKVEEVELPELEDSASKMWSVDVTDEMKDSVMEGQTMFRIKDEVDRWRDKYGGAPVHTLTRENALDYLNSLPVWKELVEDEEDTSDALNYYYSTKTSAITLPNTGEIIIFADNVKDSDELEKHLFHENIHSYFVKNGNRDLYKKYWDDNKELNPNLAEQVMREYDEPLWEEEYFTYMLAGAMVRGSFDQRGFDDFDISDILKHLNYDREQETKERREQRGYNDLRSGGIQKVHGVSGEEKEAEGAIQAEGQQAGLEPLSETDPLKRAEQIRFREKSVSNRLQSAVEMYEEAVMVASGRGFLEMIKDKTYFGRVRNEFVEAWVNGIRSVKAIQNAIERSTGKKIEGYEDVFSSLNAKSSMDGIEAEMVKQHFILPLMTHVAEMTKGKTLDGKPIDMDDVEIYMNAVHGIERNKRMAERELDAYVERMAEEHSLSKEEKEALRQESASKFRKDYSGLTELFKRPDDKRVSIKSLEKRAQEYAEMFEAAVGKENADKMWKLVGALTDYSLEKSYNSGIISKKQYDDTKSMYEHYIPLRGWHDNYAGDVYQYITRGARDVMQRTLRTARGRTSRAGDIFGTMEMMAVSAIMEGNKNLVKQKFYHLARNTGKDTGLLMVTDLWYEENANGEIVPVENPNLHDGMTAEEMRQAIEEHEERMNELKEEGKVFKMRSRDNFGKQFPLHMKKWQEQNHAVRVLLGGEEKLVYVLGNPRAAMAINGLLSKDAEKDENSFVKWSMAFMRFLSASITSFSPEFLVGNMQRDVLDALTTSRIKEGRKGARRFAKNYASLVGKDWIFKLINAYKKGELDMSNPTHRYFKEFMDNGGMAGVGSIYDEKRYQREMQDMMAQMQRGMLDAPRKAVKGFMNLVEFANQGIENGTRFAGYMSSRQSGKSITESIYDSKELTTNFNMKGSGAWGNLWVRRYILFANPAIQSLRKMYELVKGHPKRFLGTHAITVTMGFVTALLNYLAASISDDDDDDNDYWKLNSWNRCNYINIYTGNGFLHWSIPHDKRPFWTLGCLIFDLWAGRITIERAIQTELAALFNLSPIAFYEGGSDTDDSIWKGLLKGFTPSVAKPFFDVYGWNEDFMGGRITGQTDFNKHLPEWQRVTGESPQFMYDLSRAFNEATGGRHNKKSWEDSEALNPDALWYLIKSFTGGIGQMATRAVKAVEQIGDPEQELDWRNVPFVPKFYVGVGTQSAKNRVVNDKFWLYWTEYKAADKELSKNTKDAAAGLITKEEMAKTIEERKSDGTYQSWYKMEHSGLVSLYDYATEVEDDDLKQQVKKWAVDLIEKGVKPSYGEVFDASSDAETRKALGKAIAQKNGTTDEYGEQPNKNAKEETKNAALIYREERTSHDVEEDTRLMKMQQDAEDAGDESLFNTINKKRGDVNEKRLRLGKPSVGIAEGMKAVREKRTKAFKDIEEWKKKREKKEKETE